jgi:hypothetical protein
VLGIAAVVLILVVVFATYQNLKLKKQVFDFRHRNPTEVDLELATHEQIMLELRKRPLRYIFVLPQFHVENEEISLNAVSVEASGLPPEVAKDVMSKACSVMCDGEGQWHKEE